MIAPGFTPRSVTRIVVATDGSLAAMIDGDRVVVVPVAGGDGCEVGLPTGDCDLGWLGARLIVVARGDGYSTAYLIDVADHAPRAIAEIRLESAIRLAAAVGNHALVIGARGPAILTASDSGLAPYQFMTRSSPTVVGVAGGVFLVGLPGAIEEWDPVSRAPKRRFKLTRAGTIAGLGGSERLVWWWTQQDPTRIDVLPLVNRGQPKTHEVAEPIAAVLAHPQSDLIACVIGHQLRAIDLDGRTPPRTVAVPMEQIDAAALVVSRGVAALVARNGTPLALVSIDGRDLAPAERRATSQAERDDAPAPAASSLYDDQPAPEPPPAEGLDDLRGKLAAMRARAFGDSTDEATYTTRSAGPAASGPLPVLVVPARAAETATWRDDLAIWVRLGTFAAPIPSCPPIDALVHRLQLPIELAPAIALIYGSHLAGLDGAAPMDVARVLGHRWDDALGRGRLADRRVAVYERSRVTLAPDVRRSLDDAP